MSGIRQEQASGALEKVLVQRERFLSFIAARVEDKTVAEDILQTAYLKVVEQGSEIREHESTVAWFYRILRNAVIDHYRRRASRARAQETFAAETPESFELEIKPTVCKCIGDVIGELKPEYRAAIEQVDLEEIPVEKFAEEERITPNNASVRLHRARTAVAKHLKAVCGVCAEHKCLDCTCRRTRN